MHGMLLILILTRRVCLPCSYVCTSGTEAYDCDSKIKMTLYEASTMNLQLKNRVVQLSEQLEALQDVVAKKAANEQASAKRKNALESVSHIARGMVMG